MDLTKIMGVDTSSLDQQFDAAVPGRVLLFDGDISCYVVAATVKGLDTAVRRYIQAVLEVEFLVGAEHTRIHLTGKSFKAGRRFLPTHQLYQGNRDGQKKPPLVDPLRFTLAEMADAGQLPEHWHLQLQSVIEADDALVTDSVQLGDTSIVYSGDKDLRLAPGPYWEIETGTVDIIKDRFGYIKEGMTPGGSLKVKGHGTKFFWWQMLAGDTADHVKGLLKLNGKSCGPARALEYLLDIDNERECAIQVLSAYAEINQPFLPEAECMWLLRGPTDSAYAYIKSLQLPPALDSWLEAQKAWCDTCVDINYQATLDYEVG